MPADKDGSENYAAVDLEEVECDAPPGVDALPNEREILSDFGKYPRDPRKCIIQRIYYLVLWLLTKGRATVVHIGDCYSVRQPPLPTTQNTQILQPLSL